jgi:superfamily II RNA helicase
VLKCLVLSASLALLMLGGCANDPVPTEQLRLSEQAVAQARSMEASEAYEELVRAESNLSAARAALAAGDNREARMLAEQAELDARLAEARVLKDQRQAQIDDLTRRIQRLRQQLGEVR